VKIKTNRYEKTCNKKILHLKSSMINRFNIWIVVIILLISPQMVWCDWNVGSNISFFPIVGNLDLTEPSIEYEVITSYKTDFSLIYSFGISRINPVTGAKHKFMSVDLTTCWLLRSTRIKIWKLETLFTTGFGFTLIEKINRNSRKIFQGSGSLRSDFDLVVKERSEITFLSGFSYRGSPLHGTDWYTDRFGIKLSIVW